MSTKNAVRCTFLGTGILIVEKHFHLRRLLLSVTLQPPNYTTNFLAMSQTNKYQFSGQIKTNEN